MHGPSRGGTTAYDATLVGRRDLTATIASFRVRSDAPPLSFVPGQYVTIGLAVDDRLVQRPYSIASSARRLEDGYELYVRLVPGGALTPHLFATRVGDRLSLRRPKGRFTLAPNDARTHLFVATGCGLAPFMSMLRTLDDDATPRDVVVLHGVSYQDELGYRDELESWSADPRWRLRYIPTVSRPREARNAGWSGRTGRAEAILSEVLSELGIDAARSAAYVCGNPEMTTYVEGILRDRGFDASAVHTELYWPLRTARGS